MFAFLAKNPFWTEKPETVVRVALFASDENALTVDTIVSPEVLWVNIRSAGLFPQRT